MPGVTLLMETFSCLLKYTATLTSPNEAHALIFCPNDARAGVFLFKKCRVGVEKATGPSQFGDGGRGAHRISGSFVSLFPLPAS